MQRTYAVRFALVAILAFIILSSFSGCGQENEANTDRTIYLALAGPLDTIEALGFQNGVNLALAQIDEAGILAGRNVVVDVFDDENNVTTGVRIAHEIVSAGKYSAVMGHFNTDVAIATREIYDKGSLLVISPLVSGEKLTAPTLQYVFKNIVSDEAELDTLLSYAAKKRWRRLAVVYRNDGYGTGMAALINRKCREYGIEAVDFHREFINEDEFRSQYEKWKALNVDAVYVGDSLPAAEEFISLIRGVSRSLPILGTAGFNLADITADLSAAKATNLVYTDPLRCDVRSPSYREFYAAYKERYEAGPGYLSASGYSTTMLLLQAAQQAQAIASPQIAQELRAAESWETLFGSIRFDEAGNAEGGSVAIIRVNGGRYIYE